MSKRSRSVNQTANLGGVECPGESEMQESRQCNPSACPVNCALAAWSPWTDCSKTCAGGTRTRSRSVAVEKKMGGKRCKGPTSASEACNSQGCPVNCKWDSWAFWTTCSKTCGSGQRERKRGYITRAANGGKHCTGSEAQGGLCNVMGCPVNCAWNDWQEWANCSSSCGAGTRSRLRTQGVYARNGGTPCTGTSSVTGHCPVVPCPVDCVMHEWAEWGACTVTCGLGNQVRIRTFGKAMHGGKPCVASDAVQRKNCTALGSHCPAPVIAIGGNAVMDNRLAAAGGTTAPPGAPKVGSTTEFFDEFLQQGVYSTSTAAPTGVATATAPDHARDIVKIKVAEPTTIVKIKVAADHSKIAATQPWTCPNDQAVQVHGSLTLSVANPERFVADPRSSSALRAAISYIAKVPTACVSMVSVAGAFLEASSRHRSSRQAAASELAVDSFDLDFDASTGDITAHYTIGCADATSAAATALRAKSVTLATASALLVSELFKNGPGLDTKGSVTSLEATS